MKGYYWTCPYCGANLDPEEHCECEILHKQAIKRNASNYQEIERKGTEKYE